MSDEKITIEVDWEAIKDVEQKACKALALTGDVLQDEMRQAQVIPRDTGALQGEKFFVDKSQAEQGIVTLNFEGPYARRLYYHPEFNFRRDKNPNARGLWFRPWLGGGEYEKRVQHIFAAIMEKVL